MSARKSARKRNLTVKKAAERLEHQIVGAGFPLGLVVPPFDQKEIDEAKFAANDILNQLSKRRAGEDSDEPASRRRTLCAVFMYQMTVQGMKNVMTELMAKARALRGIEKSEKELDNEKD